MTSAQGTIWNRTEMHSGIRGATELLQQEVGQAGRITLPATMTLINAVVANPAAPCDAGVPATNALLGVQVSSVAGLFAVPGANPSYIMLTTMDGDAQESFKVAAFAAGPPATINACFANNHPAGTVLVPLGGFATGIVPPLLPSGSYLGYPNGSTALKLKLYGDINGDGNMVYVEYTCDPTTSHNLYRNVMAFDATSKPVLDDS